MNAEIKVYGINATIIDKVISKEQSKQRGKQS